MHLPGDSRGRGCGARRGVSRGRGRGRGGGQAIEHDNNAMDDGISQISTDSVNTYVGEKEEVNFTSSDKSGFVFRSTRGDSVVTALGKLKMHQYISLSAFNREVMPVDHAATEEGKDDAMEICKRTKRMSIEIGPMIMESAFGGWPSNYASPLAAKFPPYSPTGVYYRERKRTRSPGEEKLNGNVARDEPKLKKAKTCSKVIDYSDPFAVPNLLESLDSGKYGSVTKEIKDLIDRRRQTLNTYFGLDPMLMDVEVNLARGASKENLPATPSAQKDIIDLVDDDVANDVPIERLPIVVIDSDDEETGDQKSLYPYREIVLPKPPGVSNEGFSDILSCVDKQAEKLRNISSRYEHDKKFRVAAVNNLEEKIKAINVMKEEHSQLSHEAHECSDSIPEMNKMVFAVQSLDGFGEKGKPASGDEGGVPPNAMLQITVELVSSKPVTEVKDDKVIKKILKEGEGYDRPNDGATVKLKLIGKLEDGTIFLKKGHDNDEELFEFKTDEEQVIEGLDIAVMTMKKGEIALLTVAPKYAFGSSESYRELAVVPPNSYVMYSAGSTYYHNDSALPTTTLALTDNCLKGTAICQILGFNVKGWCGRLVFSPSQCLLFPTPTPFFCCVVPALYPIFVPEHVGTFDVEAPNIAIPSLSLAQSNK
ncbi:Peptidyl-prolyl cis-trans isomerase FKBP62 [Camellia lanceoleosa]|uniref:Peptidyl-prolyl cis-trans isomerase FKBP62 n=1 Tax=Camellia lanceoleosa TaxID=1840588 RepID=A0ACC0FMY5_9ERIC|nr:Peptidyl-prolyl cis-trans isomerase FKBP62 [Camellia lanceoleosa]